MNYALIFAGGTGTRMNSKTLPKQFLELHGKPIIIYTLELFDAHPEIDGMVVVCLEDYIPYLKQLLKKFRIEKVRAIVPGGKNGQESIWHGVKKLHELCPEDSIILVHDGVRPLINEDTITDNIACAKEHGNAITICRAAETIVVQDDENSVVEIADRPHSALARAPQTFRLGDLYRSHEKAIAEGREDFIDSASLMRYYGATLHTVQGPVENIKITTPSDFYIFRAIKDAQEDSQIFGL